AAAISASDSGGGASGSRRVRSPLLPQAASAVRHSRVSSSARMGCPRVKSTAQYTQAMLPESWLSTPFAWLIASAVLLGLLGFWAAIALVRALRGRRPLRAVIRLLLMIALDLAAVAAVLLALALHGYSRFTTETPVARLSFQQAGERAFDATVVAADGRRFDVPLAGDDWQLDARV